MVGLSSRCVITGVGAYPLRFKLDVSYLSYVYVLYLELAHPLLAMHMLDVRTCTLHTLYITCCLSCRSNILIRVYECYDKRTVKLLVFYGDTT